MNANNNQPKVKWTHPNELKVSLVENNIKHITETLQRIETKIDKVDTRIDRIEHRLWTIAFTLLITVGGCLVSNYWGHS
jgi:hypothetical protein